MNFCSIYTQTLKKFVPLDFFGTPSKCELDTFSREIHSFIRAMESFLSGGSVLCSTSPELAFANIFVGGSTSSHCLSHDIPRHLFIRQVHVAHHFQHLYKYALFNKQNTALISAVTALKKWSIKHQLHEFRQP